MDRHSSGGVSFLWKGKLEKELKQREQNQLFKKLTSNSEGNVGTFFLYVVSKHKLYRWQCVGFKENGIIGITQCSII